MKVHFLVGCTGRIVNSCIPSTCNTCSNLVWFQRLVILQAQTVEGTVELLICYHRLFCYCMYLRCWSVLIFILCSKLASIPGLEDVTVSTPPPPASQTNGPISSASMSGPAPPPAIDAPQSAADVRNMHSLELPLNLLQIYARSFVIWTHKATELCFWL